jgi:serine/threonine protein kinase
VRYCSSCHSVYPNEFRTCPKDQSELLTASELQPGMILRGKYEILGKLGAGGMAAVYRARHLAFGEIRAIKVVNNRLADDEDFLRRFRNEAVVARRLQHPNAVRVDDLDMTEDGRPFIVMELVDGQNLREAVRHQGAFSLRRSVRIARQVASALAAAHALGIVHRDIKPDNILLAGTGDAETAKVLDFGIAKMKESALGDSGALSTRTGMVVGTPQYISPEQAMGRRGSDLDGRADLYSLGVVLYEMVTGRLPFESDTAMGLILHHLQTPPPSPHDVRPDLGIPAPLTAVLLRALQKEPAQRFHSATEMAEALEEILALPLPEAAASSPGAGRDGRPLTPYPVPADIDRHETRVMPKTPAYTVPPPLPAAATALRTPPPIPRTPVPSPTMVAGTPTAAGSWVTTGTPPPLRPPLPPPPLPPATAVLEPPRVRRKRRWFFWVLATVLVVMFCNRDRSKTRPHQTAAVPSPGSGDSVDVDARAARDDQIKTAVERALRDNPRTRRQDIDVEVDEGIVSLSGHAPAAAAHDAEMMARHVDGVREVLNTIEAEGEDGASGPGPHGAGPHGPLGPDFRVPSPPAPPRGAPPPNAENLRDLLRDGRAALKAGEPGEALGKFGAALGIDPENEEARQGMKEATLLLGETIRRHVQGKPSPRP